MSTMSPSMASSPRAARLPGLLCLFGLTAGLVCACGSGDGVSAHERAEGPDESATRRPTALAEADATDPDSMADWAYLSAHTPSYKAPTEWDGTITGMKTLWHPNGAKRGEGEYANSEKTGPWIYWHDNGQKRWEGTYVEDLPQGLEHAWYDDGTEHYVGKFEDGLREGPFSYWHENGQLWWKGPFKHDKREGTFIQWKRNGDLDEQGSGVYRDGKRVRELPAGVLAEVIGSNN